MKRRLIFLLALVVAAGCWILLAPSLANYLIVERPLEYADAIIVLSGSAAYKERTAKAAELYRQGVSPRIFLTNDGEKAGWSKEERRNPKFIELAQLELTTNGVPPEAITILPGRVSGTDYEAKAVASEIDTRPIKTLLIVTSAYHTRRALWTFDKILSGKGVEIGIEHSPLNDQTPKTGTWWLGLSGWQTVGGEYTKSAVYWFYY